MSLGLEANVTLHLSGLSDGLKEDKGGFGVVRNDDEKSWYIV